MSTWYKKIVGYLSCDDEKGWARLANPASFYLRNAALLGIILALWFRDELHWYTVLLVIGFVGLARFALSLRDYHYNKHWHVEAIKGERYLVCHGLSGVSSSLRVRLLALKMVDLLGLFGLVWGLYFFSGGIVLLASAVFFGIRLGLLYSTRAIYLQSGSD
jgi:hypothetical protein